MSKYSLMMWEGVVKAVKNGLQINTDVGSLLSDPRFLLFQKNREEFGIIVKLLFMLTLKLTPNLI